MKKMPRLRSTLDAKLQAGVVDRHHFDADPDQPTFYSVADPDPDPDHTTGFTHVFGKSEFVSLLVTVTTVVQVYIGLSSMSVS